MSRPDSCAASSIRASRSRTPMTLVVNPSSTGGSNDTSPAQCTTASMSVGSAGTSARSPSTTATRAAISASTPPAGLDDVGEDRLLEQLGGPVGAAGRALGPHQDAGAQVRDVAQDQVQQRLADEARHAGEQDVLPRQTLRDRPLRHARDAAMWLPVVEPGGALTSWVPCFDTLASSRLNNRAHGYVYTLAGARGSTSDGAPVLGRLPPRQPGQPVAQTVHLGPHPVRVGPGVVAERPADRLAQPEATCRPRWPRPPGAAGPGRSSPRRRPGRSPPYAAPTGPRPPTRRPSPA